jgi:hypothetical protein
LKTAASGVGHGEEEEPFATVRRANLRRREESALNEKTQSVKVIVHATRTSRGEHPRDVFDEDEVRSALDDDAAGVGPEVSLVARSLAIASDAVRLAGDTANEEIHRSTPLAARK